MAHSGVFYIFWATARPSECRGSGVTYPLHPSRRA